ncbi:MAG: FimV/HubP family polar landmark protein [Sulfuricaulis sp.]
MALISRWVFVIVLALAPITSHALALGTLKVHSALNQPLNAEIAFTTITEKELKGLKVSLASRADFNAAGVDRPPFLAQIKFIVEKNPDGQYYLQLQTDQPVDEPYLHFLMQVDWPGGRLVREYTALIDPPYQIASKAAPVEVPQVTPPAPVPAPVAQVAPPAPVPAAPQAEMPKEETPPVAAKSETPQAAPPEETQAVEAPPKPEETATPSATAPAPVPAPTEATPPQEQLLGPPEATEGAAPEESAAPEVEPLAAKPKEQKQAAAAPQEQPAAAPEEKPAPSPAWATISEYDVKKGDTLWRVADKARAENKDLSIEQVMLAIYRSNKDAFFGNNINNLKAGKILKMPERETVEAVTPSQAHHEFRVQYDAWLEYKLKLASASRAIKVTEAPEAASTEKATTPVEKPAAAAVKPVKPEAKTPKTVTGTEQKAKQEELLKIVRSTLQKEKGTPDKNVADKESSAQEAAQEKQALADRAATLEESLESKRLENKDLSEKVGIVRSQLNKESRLIQLENQSLAQDQAKTKTPTAPASKPVEPAAKPAGATSQPPEQVAALKPEEKIKSEALPPAKPAPRHIAPKKHFPPPAPPKEEEKGFLATVLDALQSDLLMPVIIGIVVLLGGAVALVYFRRRQKSIAEFEESILSADAISTEQPATTGNTGTPQAAVTTGGDTSFLSDFSQGGMGNIHTDEVDPVAEAEVYLAYGRDETAEEILKEAMVKNPDRQELKLKLLEIYHQRNDVAAFETLAEELYAALGGRGGKVWSKVEEMGRKLNPENPMFRGGAPGAPASPSAAKSGAAITTPAAAHADMPLHAGDKSKTEAAGDFDFDLDASVKGGDKSVADAIDFSAAPGGHAGKAGMDSHLESLDVGTPDNGVNFDIGGKNEEASDLDFSALNPAVPAGNDIKWEPEPAAATAGGDVNIDAAAPPAGEVTGSGQWDETATKLDLAKAYIDMGDAEGARSILQEVMSEGSAAQKQQAQELSSQIA